MIEPQYVRIKTMVRDRIARGELGPGAGTEGGRLIIPIGELRRQELVRVVRHGDGYEESRHGPATFVPLVGREGF